MHQSSKSRRLWGGFSNGHLAHYPARDAYGWMEVWAVFRTKAEATKRYSDVRPIEIEEVRRGKR